MAWTLRLVGGRLRWRLIRSALFVATSSVFFAPTFGLLPPLAFHNTGRSEPEGYYVYSHPVPARRGDIVVLRDPPHFRLSWLMKTVEGVAGDRYCWDQRLGTQRLNGRPMPPPDPAAEGLRIPVWRGCTTLEDGEVVGYGHSADSYDSRYFGPVREEQLWGVYRSLWIGPRAGEGP